MKMVPPGISRSSPSPAERRLFSLLASTDLSPDAVCLHSLNLAEHRYKQMGELDFVVLAPQGLLVIEVKGGGIAVEGGVWTYTDRFSREHTNYEGPFKQAISGMFSLKDQLEEKLSRLRTGNINFGWAVAFPDCDFDANSVEWPQVLVLDAQRLRHQQDLDEVLQAVFDYWKNKHLRATETPAEVIRELLFAMRPEFELVPSLINDVDRITDKMERLTNEQYERLDIIADCDRIVCAGGAGTGKTFLAMEVARRASAEGKSVVLLCSSRILAEFLQTRLTGVDVDVLPYDDAVGAEERYDVLIADEAQDFLDADGLVVMDRLVVGGLQEGRWVVFVDPNAQSGLVGRFDEESIGYLRAMGAVPASLRRNCRNTIEVVTQTTLLTAADIGIAIAGHGPSVGFSSYSGRAEAISVLQNELQRLHDESIPPGLITILSPLQWKDSIVRDLPGAWTRKISRLDESSGSQWPSKTMTFATITDFKGLENDFILLVDVESLSDSPRHRSEVYVAMTRARSSLWISIPEALEHEIERLGMENLHLIKGILERSEDV